MRGAGLRLLLRFSAVLRQMRKTNAVAYCGERYPHSCCLPLPSPRAPLLARAQADVPTKPLKHSICAWKGTWHPQQTHTRRIHTCTHTHSHPLLTPFTHTLTHSLSHVCLCAATAAHVSTLLWFPFPATTTTTRRVTPFVYWYCAI